MKRDFIRIVIKREKNYNKKKWRLIKFVIIILSFIFTSIITLVINEINNLNKMFPYQVLLDGIDREIFNHIKNSNREFNIDEIGIYTDLGTADNNKYNVIYVDEIGMGANKLKLIEGELPCKYNEIAIQDTYDIKTGDIITLTYFASISNKKRVEDFIVTGRLNSTLKANVNEDSIIVSEDYWNRIVGNESRNVIYVNYNKKEKSEIYKNNELIQEKYNIRQNQIYVNDDYIEGIFGNPNQFMLVLIFCCICIFITRSIIYTIYCIYYNERLTYIRKLKLLGMTSSDLNKMSQYEVINVFAHSLWGYLLAMIVLLSYMKLQVNFILTLSCMIVISLNLYCAIYSATKKQLKGILNCENLIRSKFEFISTDFNEIRPVNSSMITIMDLVKRNNKIYKRRNILIRRSIKLTCIMLIIISTLYASIRFEKLMSDIYIYDEEFVIYPDLRNMKEDLITFQKNNVFNDHLISEIKNIDGIKDVIKNNRISATIKNDIGLAYECSVQIGNNFIHEKLENYMIDGHISDDKILVNKWRMEGVGLEFEIGDYLLIKQTDNSDYIRYIIGGVFDNHNSGDLLYLPKKYETNNNPIYSLSIIIEEYVDANMIKNRLNNLLQDYPQLRIRSYFTELNDIRSSFSILFILLQVIIALFFIIAITNTINIVNLDLLSRIRDFTLLEINGMTRRDLIKLLLFEYGSNLIKAVVCIFISSYLISYIISRVAETLFRIGYLSYNYSYTTLIAACSISVLVIFLLIIHRVSKLDKNLAIKPI